MATILEFHDIRIFDTLMHLLAKNKVTQFILDAMEDRYRDIDFAQYWA